MSGDLGAAMPKTPVSQPKLDTLLPDFRKVGSHGYVFEPSTKSTPVTAPELIILCTWMDGAVKHIAKYAKTYTTQFPDSTLLLIQSDVSELTWRSFSSQLQRMEPVAAFMKDWAAQHESSTQPPRVLAHVFSNGGSWQICVLAEAYERIQANLPELPVSALIMDSTPSLLHPSRAHTAMTTGLPKSPIVQVLGSIFFWIVIGLMWVCDTLKLQENPLLSMRAILNDPKGPFLGQDKPRLYIYSKTDKLVPADDVILHASDARSNLEEQGVERVEDKIRLEEFTGSNHVAHMMADPKRYWKVIEDTWKQALTWY